MIINEDKNKNQNEIKTEDVHTGYEWIMRQLHFDNRPRKNKQTSVLWIKNFD